MKFYVCILVVTLCACLAQGSPFSKIVQKIGDKVGDVVKGSDEPKPEGDGGSESGGLLDKMKDKAVDKAVAVSLDKLGDAAIGDTEKVKIDGGIGQKVLGHVADAMITRGAELAKSQSHKFINSLDDPKEAEPKKPEVPAEEVKQRRKRSIADPTMPAKTGLVRNIMGRIKSIPSKVANIWERSSEKLSKGGSKVEPEQGEPSKLPARRVTIPVEQSLSIYPLSDSDSEDEKVKSEEEEEKSVKKDDDDDKKDSDDDKKDSDDDKKDSDDDKKDSDDDDDDHKKSDDEDDDDKKDDDDKDEDDKKDDRKSEVKKENPSSE